MPGASSAAFEVAGTASDAGSPCAGHRAPRGRGLLRGEGALRGEGPEPAGPGREGREALGISRDEEGAAGATPVEPSQAKALMKVLRVTGILGYRLFRTFQCSDVLSSRRCGSLAAADSRFIHCQQIGGE